MCFYGARGSAVLVTRSRYFRSSPLKTKGPIAVIRCLLSNLTWPFIGQRRVWVVAQLAMLMDVGCIGWSLSPFPLLCQDQQEARLLEENRPMNGQVS